MVEVKVYVYVGKEAGDMVGAAGESSLFTVRGSTA
jgi:hypothetical protein